MFPSFRAELFDPSIPAWLKIKDAVVAIEQEGFEIEPFTEAILETDFLEPENIVVLLKKGDSEEVLGFTYAKPFEPETAGSPAAPGETAWMWDTVIQKEYRDKGLLGVMMETLEEELRRRGFTYLERNAREANGFAQSITKHYKERIIESFPLDSKWGPQVFFRIKL
jgi:ribosomal protein S18 acetylase RimI-like enzyme